MTEVKNYVTGRLHAGRLTEGKGYFDMNMMYTHDHEPESLKMLRQAPEQFPQANQCIKVHTRKQQTAQSSVMNSVEGTLPVTEQAGALAARMEVIWAGRENDKNNRIVCVLMSFTESTLNAYVAKVVDQDGKEITASSFVSFERDIAFATMLVPIDIFDECIVQMDMTMVGQTVRTAAAVISLKQFDVRDISVTYEIEAPRITRPGKRDRIAVSYYKYSSAENFDYVYPGRSENQMYFPSAGVITIQGVELQDADMDLSLWDAAKGERVECSTPEKLHVEDSVITYCFAEKWEGKKLSDCYDLKRTNTNVKYLLAVKALEKNGKSVELTITNEASILGVEKDDARKHEIPGITVYLDCFAEGTLIRMADGTEKKVEDICGGDLIRTSSGEAVSVRMTQKQDDCQVISIVLENGRSLAVTDGHAIAAVDGALPAYRLKAGQEVITEEGAVRIVRILPRCERLYQVYALFLEGEEEWLFADGIKAHSSESGDLFRDMDWVREDLPQEWREDYDNALKAGILYGKQ